MKGTAEQSEAKNHPVNGFLVPRAGGVPPDKSLLLRQLIKIREAFPLGFLLCASDMTIR